MPIASLDEVDRGSEWACGAHAALGFFDGVHLGHQHLLRRARQEAERAGGHALVFTFQDHPLTVLRPESAPPLISSFPERLELLEKAGMDRIVWHRFDRAFSEMAADAFVRRILVERLAVRSVVVGPNYRFGHGAAGGVDLLRELGRQLGFSVHVVEPVFCNGELVSSSGIREHVARGEVDQVEPLLTREFDLRATVEPGERRGRELGFPTANLAVASRAPAGPAADLLPADGVYATRFELRGELLPSVTNVGVRPTFGMSRRVIETHVLDFNGDLYGKSVRLRFVRRIRGERRFAGMAELRRQIAADVAQARDVLPART